MRAKVLLLSALLLASMGRLREAGAQALPTATAPGAFISVGGTYSLFNTDYGQQKLGGAGAYIDINPRRQVGLEAEAHWLRQNSTADIHQTTYLVGPRIQLKHGRFSPYGKFLVGQGIFNFPYNYEIGKYLVFAPGGGLDYYVNDNLRLRLIDIEYQDWRQFTFGTLSPYGVSIGLSYRIFNGSSGRMRHP